MTEIADDAFFKFLDPGAHARHGVGKWAEPKNGKPGRWMPKRQPVLCQSGYHLCTADHLITWLGPELYVAEGRGKSIVGDNKIVFESARLLERVDTWNDRSARLFAADCAERVLGVFEKRRPKDHRPRDAIVVARRYANGDATIEELRAAWDAAWDAAWAAGAAGAAAKATVWAAVWDGTAGDAAKAAAGDAAGAAARAAGDAAWAAVWDGTAGDAETGWQQNRLMQYLRGDTA